MARKKAKPPLREAVQPPVVDFMAPPSIDFMGSPSPTHPLQLADGEWDWDKIVGVLCDRLVGSTQYLSAVVEEGYEGWEYPPMSKIRYKIYRDPNYKTLYREARVIQTDGLVDMMHRVVSDDSNDMIQDANGPRPNSAAVSRSKLITEHYKWYVGVIDSNEWAGTTKVEHSGKVELEGILDELRNQGAGKLPSEESPIE